MKNVVKNLAILFVLFFGLCLFALSNQRGGWQTFIVKSGSMQPQIPIGALVISKYTHPIQLQKDDIITFIRPTKEREFITHRVTKITNSEGYISLKTKGDNNKTADEWDVPGGSVVGKVVYTIPYIGYLMSFAQSKVGILIFILIPASYIVVEEVNTIINLLKARKPEKIESSMPAIALLLLGTLFYSSHATYALLSDSTLLTNNTFTVIGITPTPTIIPTLMPAPTITPTPILACEDENDQETKKKSSHR